MNNTTSDEGLSIPCENLLVQTLERENVRLKLELEALHKASSEVSFLMQSCTPPRLATNPCNLKEIVVAELDCLYNSTSGWGKPSSIRDRCVF